MLAALVLVSSMAGPAAAEMIMIRPVSHPSPWHLEGGMGWRVGSQLVDGASSGTVNAFHAEGGARNDRLLLTAEYQLSELQLSDDAFAARGAMLASGNGRGLEHRLSANARYSFARLAESDGGADFYVEGGLGVEHYRWDAGGAWTRPDVSFGTGASVWGRGDTRHGRPSVGLRVTLARRDDLSNAPIACGGPCNYATSPTGIDRSFLFDMTIMFGK